MPKLYRFTIKFKSGREAPSKPSRWAADFDSLMNHSTSIAMCRLGDGARMIESAQVSWKDWLLVRWPTKQTRGE